MHRNKIFAIGIFVNKNTVKTEMWEQHFDLVNNFKQITIPGHTTRFMNNSTVFIGDSTIELDFPVINIVGVSDFLV